MKSVCIIGAGPGGLVAAKTFLQTGAFNVTVFEQNNRLGGIWAFEAQRPGNAYLSVNTPTNLSRYTVGFSDLSWESADLRDGRLPMFPSAADVGKYLETYRARYVPDSLIRYGQRVVTTKRVGKDNQYHWQVTTKSVDGKQNSDVFDFLLNSAGFFASPRPISTPLPSGTNVTAVHTSKFRMLEDLFPDPSVDVRGQKILIYGGGNSAGETAGNIALQISSAIYSPTSASRTRFADVQVFHVTPRPLYSIPPYIRSSLECPTFVPLDLQFYNLQWRLPGPIRSNSGPLPPDVAKQRYAAIHGMVGDQGDLGSAALVTTEMTAPYVALSEFYTEFVRSGSIRPIAGRLTGWDTEGRSNTIAAEIQSSDGNSTMINDIAAVVHATGYTTEPALTFLPDDVKHALEYDPECQRLPVILQQYQTLNPSVPDLAFIGFYEGPYWGVMEMQARLIAARWGASHFVPEMPDESLEKLRALRQAMKTGAKNVPQYWFSDYVGYLEEMSHELKLKRLDKPFSSEREGPVSPARYLAPSDDHSQAQMIIADIKRTLYVCAQGKYRARAAFRALQGNWKLERTIHSKRSELPSGTLTGTAHFYPRLSTSSEADLEYLYVESGTFIGTNGFRMTASRRYVYRYTEATDKMNVWFVKPKDDLSVDYLFHDLAFDKVVRGERCTAHAEHPCGNDYYTTNYNFEFRTVTLQNFKVQHDVKGPFKDYLATSQYYR